MDKYEYKVRSDEIKELIAKGEYVQAAEIADTIDWRRVKSVMMLCTIGDLYKINRRYEDAKNMLLLAYDRRPGGRTICYSLCELCIKTEEFLKAVEYYKEFVQAAPKDPGRYILQYKIYEAQDVSLEERIGVLEELKKRDYREKWAYELAYLYHRVGLATRCVEECDELILWFGEGKYVVKAMELKMLHKPLTPTQQEKYDHRFDEPEAEEDGSWNTEAQEQEEGQWGSYARSQGESQEPAYGQAQGGHQWNAYDQRQGEGQWNAYGQAQESQWNTYDQTQKEDQWNAYGQTQEDQGAAHDQIRDKGPWNIYSQAQESQETVYDQTQEEGQWNTYGQAQEGQGTVYDQAQEESQWNAYGQAREGRGAAYDRTQEEGQWNVYDRTQEEQWNMEENSQEEEPWDAYGQAQDDQWNVRDQVQRKGRWDSGDQSQETGQFRQDGRWEVYGQSGGHGSDFSEAGAPTVTEAETSPVSEQQDELDIQVKTMDVSQYNTINLQAELAAGLQEVLGAEELADSFVASMPASDENESEGSGAAAQEGYSTGLNAAAQEGYSTDLNAAGQEGYSTDLNAAGQEGYSTDLNAAGQEGYSTDLNAAGQEGYGTDLNAADQEENSTEVKETPEALPNDGVEDESVVIQDYTEKVHDESFADTAEADSLHSSGRSVKSNAVPEDEESAAEVNMQERMPAMTIEAGINDVNSSEVTVPIDHDDFATGPMETEREVVRDDTAELVLAQMRLENAGKMQAEMVKSRQTQKVSQQESVLEKFVPPLLKETDDEVSTALPESNMVEKQITGQMKIEDILAEWEQTKRDSEEKYKEEIRQDVLRQTGPMFTEFEAAARDGLLERLEKGETADLEEISLSQEATESKKNGNPRLSGKLIQMDELRRMSGKSKKEKGIRGERSGRAGAGEEPRDAADLQKITGQSAQEHLVVETESSKKLTQKSGRGRQQESESLRPEALEKGGMQLEPLEMESLQPEPLESGGMQLEPLEMESPQPESLESGGMRLESLEGERRQQKLPESEGMQLEPLEGEGVPPESRRSRNQQMKSPESGEMQPKPLEGEGVQPESQESGSMQPASPKSGNTQTASVKNSKKTEIQDGNIAEITAEAESAKQSSPAEAAQGSSIEREQVKVRGLTREEKELYAPFIQSRSAREKLVQAIDNISMAAYTGNIVVTGEEGMDTMTFAKNMIREVQMMDSNFSGKVAKISGESLNGRDVNETLWHLNNGALIIYHASGMEARTASALHRALQQENLGIIIILEDTKKAIQKMFLGTPELYGDFTARMDLEALSNDTLVAFGKRYAREMEYSIDNLGVLALHTRIEELQTIDHVVTVVEVKKIVDEAIRHACRKTLGHFFDILFSKRYDEEDMIILTEKDFVY